LAVIAIMRLVAWDDVQPFALLNALTAFVFLPAWFVLAVAALGRRFVLAGAALLIVVAQIAFLLPEVTAAEPVPSWARNAPTITLIDGNVYNLNASMAGYAREITQVRPELVTMEEANPLDATQLTRSGALHSLPFRFEVNRYDPSAFFLASAYPLSDTHVVDLYGRPLVVQTTLELPSGALSLWVVHTTAPLESTFTQWKGQLAALANLLRTRGPTGLLVVGDFNATWGNKGFRAILGTGMTDGAAARGKAFDMTWSQTLPLLPPVARIDHVLTGPGVAVTGIRTETGPGSDHRDLVATVAIRRPLVPSRSSGHRD
jgi:endonuclease/exonuclease/phosphatase (EEP) superfamily protein YafD